MAHDDEGAVRVNIANQQNIIRIPEKELMMFVVILAIMELMASGLGIVQSVWVTVMLLKNYHEIIINMMLFFEGIHIFCHSSKLSLHHMHNVQQLPKPICFISCLFYWLELISVFISIVLSFIGLADLLQHKHNMQQDFRKSEEALVFYVFYVMIISKALVFLAARAIWKVRYCRLLEKVREECRLNKSDMDLIKRFFYDMHSKCMEVWNFSDALKMDLVTFVGEHLVSSSSDHEEQLMAASILKALSTHPRFSDAALRKIGTSKVVIERLIQMLNLENLFEKTIRYMAAVIVSELAKKEPNVLRMAGMDEAMKLANYLLDAK